MPARKDRLFLLKDLASRKIARLEKEDLDALKTIADWTRDFVAQPHPELGRAGVVCPFVPLANEKDTLWFTIEHVKDSSTLRVAQLIQEYKNLFLSLDPKEEEEGHDEAIKKTILVIFPDLPEEKAAEYIDGIQRPLKDDFVREGLMLGDFHQFSEAPGIHNPDFRPLRSPIPMLVLRHMVLADWRFLLDKAQWLQAWFHRFHDGENPEMFIEQTGKLIDAFRAAKQSQKI